MRRNKGFTLIEVMIVVAIIAILAAIAIPNYSDYVMRSKITEAVSGMSTMRVKMEQHFQDCRVYDTSTGCTLPALPANTANFGFSRTVAATTYTVTADGISGSSMDAFVFTVNQANVRATTGAPTGWTTNASCWITKKDGSC